MAFYVRHSLFLHIFYIYIYILGQNFTQAQNPNFIWQFNNNYFGKSGGPYRPQGNRFYNKGSCPNRKWNNNSYQGFQQGRFFNHNCGNNQWFPPGLMPPPIQQRSEFHTQNFHQNQDFRMQNESRPLAALQAQEHQNTDQQSQSERPVSIHAIRTFNPSYAEATASNVGGNMPQERSNNQQSKN